MKFPFFKTLLLTGALLLAWNCTDSTSVPMDALSGMSEKVHVIDIGPNENLYVAEDGTVYDSQWNVFGTYTEGNIVTNEGETFLTGVDLNERPQAKIIETNGGTKMVEFDDGSVTDIQGNNIGTVDEGGNVVGDNGEIIAENPDAPAVASSASRTNPTSAGTNPGTNPGGNSAASTSSNSSGTHNTPTSSATAQQGGQCDGQCYDAPSGKCVAYYAEQVGPNGEKYAYNNSCTLNCYWDGNNNNCKNMGGGTVTPQSSASQNPGQSSSSSKPKSSSSSKQQQTQTSTSQQSGGCPNIKYVNGGASGDGFATRYWDCCKPSCSWAENAHGNPSRQCQANSSNTISDLSARSVCNGGNAMTCTSQHAFTVNGCDNIGFAFAAVPAFASACGHCYELTFTGKGKYETKMNHQKLKGKKLIVMASNVGGDVSGGQFDIMIPGGGFGIYPQGCNVMTNWGNMQGYNTHGGLLTKCEEEVGYSGDDQTIYTKRKQCLVEKCNSIFAKDSEAKAGCLFLADFMEAAGNPLHTYKEVECPDVLKQKY
jgi:hypothetical protein